MKGEYDNKDYILGHSFKSSVIAFLFIKTPMELFVSNIFFIRMFNYVPLCVWWIAAGV